MKGFVGTKKPRCRGAAVPLDYAGRDARRTDFAARKAAHKRVKIHSQEGHEGRLFRPPGPFYLKPALPIRERA